VALIDVADTLGNKSSTFAATMSVLLGDTTNNRAVNSGDITQTKSHSGETLSGSNFRTDVTVDGSINSGDIGLVKAQSGTGVP
jgi:hypothetical protein